MTGDFLAHSAKNGCPAQTYESHIRGVYEQALEYAMEAGHYLAKGKEILVNTVKRSALLHDIGKLDSENQKALQDPNYSQHHLPINHVDAGSAILKSKGDLYAALIVYSHHKGLPNLEEEFHRQEKEIFRDQSLETRDHTNAILDELLCYHETFFPVQIAEKIQIYEGNQNVFFRMSLSCLADADHTDTAMAYQQVPRKQNLCQLRAEERLIALDRYVSGFGGSDERSRLRHEMYDACRLAESKGGFSVCDSPVGSGKTTAVMAHLLQQAILRKARHVFVVLPYTSIIQQSVDVYRKALVLPGENPKDVVAEIHSRADFQKYETRYLTSLWRAPIIVTTAVSFFETLSSHRPSALRRFHELPGSVVFIDEAHNALPLNLLPLAWRWMNILTDEWSCYWVLASGSLVRYWELERLSEIKMKRPVVTELVYPGLRDRLMKYERERVSFRWRENALSRSELLDWILKVPGPRLVILNTVQSAAVIADDLCKQIGRSHVEHLSTALTPEDREKTIGRIKKRLQERSDTDWTLVATSCVEAGVDFSFRTGFREMSSLLSLLQAAGRVNRHGEYDCADMWSFSMQDDSLLTRNKSVEFASAVLKDYFKKEVSIVPELSTRSMNDEIIRDDSCIQEIKYIIKQEEGNQFEIVDQKFKVIEDVTVPAVVDLALAKEIMYGKANWQLLQRNVVSIRINKIKEWDLKEIARGVYQWTWGYDDFLGYMYGVLNSGAALFS